MQKFVGAVTAIFWGLILVIALLLQAVVDYPLNTPKKWLGVVAVSLLLYKHAVTKLAWLGIVVHKLRLWITNPSTDWSLEVRFKLSGDEEEETVLADLQKAIERDYKSSLTSIRQEPSGALAFHIGRQINATIYVDDHDGRLIATLQIHDVTVSFRESMSRLDDYVCPLIDLMERELRLQNGGSQQYSMVVHFVDENPYFGVFVQKFNLQAVDSFSLTIKPEKKGRRFSIRKDSVQLVASSRDAFKSGVIKIFNLSSGTP